LAWYWAGSLSSKAAMPPNVLQLAQLIAQVRQIKGFSLADLFGEFFRLFVVDLILNLLDQRQHIAHT